MISHRISALAVVDRSDTLLGMLYTHAISAAVADSLLKGA